MFKREAEGESSMTISAQVIDTIVEWIDDNHINMSRVGRVRRSRHPAFLWARCP